MEPRVDKTIDDPFVCAPAGRREMFHALSTQWTLLGRHASFYDPPTSLKPTDTDVAWASKLFAMFRDTFAQIVAGPIGAMLSQETFWPESIDFPAAGATLDRKSIVQADLAMVDAMENAIVAVKELEAARSQLSPAAFLYLEDCVLTFKATVMWLRMMMLGSMELAGVRAGTFHKAKSSMIGRLCDVRRAFGETAAITISVPDSRRDTARHRLERWVADFSDAVNALPEATA